MEELQFGMMIAEEVNISAFKYEIAEEYNIEYYRNPADFKMGCKIRNIMRRFGFWSRKNNKQRHIS